MADYDFMKMTAEEIENLFLTTEMHPNSHEGKIAIQVLAAKYKRMDAKRSKRALWISIIALVISLVGIVVNAFGAEERYLCVADMATGFCFNSSTKMWEQAKFNVDDKKYIITKLEYPKGALELKIVGNQVAIHHSKEGFGPLGNVAVFEGGFSEFRVNRETGRFIRTYTGGYIGGDQNSDTPWIEIGKCSPF